MNDYIYLLVFIFIILIFVSTQRNIPLVLLILSIAAGVFLTYMFSQNSESFTDGDDLEISKYGNISTSQNIDMSQQEVPIYTPNQNQSIDNSDIVSSFISRGTTMFQPNGTGFSPINGAPDIPNNFSQYDMPLTGKQNADEMLARKQQQRSANNKRATDGSVRATRNLFDKYFKDEENENEARVWYSAEAQPIEATWTQS